MNRSELTTAVAGTTGVPHGVVDQVLAGLEEELVQRAADGEEVRWSRLFTLEVVQRAGRTGRNPQTGEAMTIPPGRAARIRVGSRLKQAARSSA